MPDGLSRRGATRARLALAALFLASPAWSDTLAAGSPTQELELDDAFVTGLSQPTSIAFLPDGRLLIAEKAGLLRVRTAAGTLVNAATFPVDAAGNERGLLNVLPHPEFASNRRLFVYYTAGAAADPGNRLVTVELGTNDQVDLGTQEVLIEGLYAENNHDGGALALYRNFLFLGVGDATGPLRANCLTSGNGKILRIDVSGSVPADNPLIGRDVTACEGKVAARPDIFAWGLRNPWRFWADPSTGNLWVGDVGDGAYEEIDVVPKAGGVHLGWPHREADHPLPGQNADVTACASDSAGGGNCLEPVHTCGRPDCESITGGLILDACEWPASLEGRYVFGDYNTRSLWTLGVNGTRTDVVGERVPLARAEGSGPVHFVEHQGALYALMFAGSGHVTRIAPRTPDAACSGSGGAGAGGSSNDAGATAGGSSSGGNSSAGSPAGGTASSAGGASGASGRPPGSTPTSGSAGDAAGDPPGNGGGSGCRIGGRAQGVLLAALAVSGVAFFLRRRRGRRPRPT